MVEVTANDSANSSGTEKTLELPTDLNKTALKEIIKQQLGYNNEEDYTVTISSASSKGDNYLGVLYRLVIKRNDSIELSLIVKLPPESEARREQFFIVPVFTRESMFYDEIYPLMKQFQEEKGIDIAEEGFHEVPKCYKTMTELRNEAIFLEDLKVSGFEMFNRFEIVDMAHVTKVMEVLGKLHAVSFGLKHERKELYKPYTEIVDIFMQRESDPNITIWLETIKKRALEVIEKDEDKEMVKRANEALQDTCFNEMKKMVNPEAAQPYTILTHGDCWNNNVMFKYENGVPTDICLLDWQIMRYASPVLDVLYYIFCCTTTEFRDAHYQEALDVYYSSLDSFLKKLGLESEKVFPKSAFESHLKKFGKFGLIMATMVLPMFTSAADDIPDMDELSEKFSNGQTISAEEITFNSEKTIDVYKKRMGDVFRDIFKLGYI